MKATLETPILMTLTDHERAEWRRCANALHATKGLRTTASYIRHCAAQDKLTVQTFNAVSSVYREWLLSNQVTVNGRPVTLETQVGPPFVMKCYTASMTGALVAKCPQCGMVCAYWEQEDLDENGNLLCYCPELDKGN